MRELQLHLLRLTPNPNPNPSPDPNQVGAERGPRERDAATFHLRRAARKLALAQALT